MFKYRIGDKMRLKPEIKPMVAYDGVWLREAACVYDVELEISGKAGITKENMPIYNVKFIGDNGKYQTYCYTESMLEPITPQISFNTLNGDLFNFL